MIKIKNLKLNKSGIDILNELSMNIDDNSVTCILGSKNSGKSSILKALAGIYRDYYGEILYNDKDINEYKEVVIDIIHGDRENDANINVYEYLNFYGSIYGKYDKKELDYFIDVMLKKFMLVSYKYTNISVLDEYDYKFIELIRVLINDPKVILFDNIFSSDNIEFNERLLDFIKTLLKKKTLVFASRSLNYLEEIITDIAIIDNGSLVIFGKKEDVYKTAELSSKVQVEVISGLSEALDILNNNKNVSDIIYTENSISFSLATNISHAKGRDEIESGILKDLIAGNVNVYSFKRQRARFEQLYERLVL